MQIEDDVEIAQERSHLDFSEDDSVEISDRLLTTGEFVTVCL